MHNSLLDFSKMESILKNRQYSLKVFETSIENEESFIQFFDTNYLLFKDHLILITGEMSSVIREYLEKNSLQFLHNVTLPEGRTRRALEEEIQIETNKSNPESDEAYASLKIQFKELALENSIYKQEADAMITKLSKKLENNFHVIDSIIRSGRELRIEGDLLLMNRVNSGATIHTTGNLIVTQVVEGALRCDGNFMMITVSPKANIIFNGVEVDNVLLKDKLNRIELKNREIYITPVIKKEINWAS